MRCTINGYEFSSDFDSGNLAKVELVGFNSKSTTNKTSSNAASQRIIHVESGNHLSGCIPDVEFIAWTRCDCEGTEFQNNNR